MLHPVAIQFLLQFTSVFISRILQASEQNVAPPTRNRLAKRASPQRAIICNESSGRRVVNELGWLNPKRPMYKGLGLWSSFSLVAIE